MTYSVVVAPEAAEQTRAVDAWWRENRPDSPDRFTIEMREVLQRLEVAPLPALCVRRSPRTYRVLLNVSRNHVYFRVDERSSVVEVLALWGGPRRRGPKLRP